MTDEEIQKIYDEEVVPPYEHAGWLSFARRIAAIEREACAKVCEENAVAIGMFCAAAIRARGEK